MVYLRNKEVSKNALIEVLFKPVSFFFTFLNFFFHMFIYSLSNKPVEEPNRSD